MGLSAVRTRHAVTARAREVDYSRYDQPLFDQITDHIKANVAARLGSGKLAHDRYFIIPFAYENRGNDPAFSHSFITVK